MTLELRRPDRAEPYFFMVKNAPNA